MYRIEEIKSFIGVFQDTPMIDFFTNCACYYFAAILHRRFYSTSSIYYNPSSVHFACNISGILYDIRGEIEDPEDYVEWEEYRGEDKDLITSTCIELKGGEY